MKTKQLAYCALFAAFIAVASQISIPMTPVPINLAVLAVLSAGAVLGLKYGTLSVVVYILLGCVGVPVFSSFRGGLGVIAGVTGGYIVGYIIIALVTGFVCERTEKLKFVIPAMILSVALCYTLGTVWYCILTGTPAGAALASCVIPFIPGDIVKIVVAVLIFKRVKRSRNNNAEG